MFSSHLIIAMLQNFQKSLFGGGKGGYEGFIL